MANDLLFELGTEELPSGAVWPLADALANNLIAGLKKAELQHGSIQRFATPRRLGVLVKNLQESQPQQTLTRRGPAYSASFDEMGNPTPALQGFARSCRANIEDLTRLKTDKGEWWIFESIKPGATTSQLLPALIREALATLPIARMMRWGEGDDEFVRPVHWAVLLFGNEVIETDFLGIRSGCKSYGHRFHHPQAVEITHPSEYEPALQDAFVMADFDKRRQCIIELVKEKGRAQNSIPVMPESLIDEVTSIVEWPQALLAGFKTEFLNVPAEALIASMQSHQKCFALRDQDGRLLPNFITVSNIASSSPESVIKGNEKVMRARLSDAAFFYQQDKKKSLQEYAEQTSNVIFQVQLGTLKEKTQRLQSLMEHLAFPLGLEKRQALRAAELSKSDLMTGMVGEFPELQGLMGYYYALNDHEDEPVAIALNEQYLPRFSGDELPKTALGLALSLADRLDTLVGIFAIGQKPSGVKDPFKLRRHALAVIRILMSVEEPLSLSTLLEEALQGYGSRINDAQKIACEVKTFVLERLHSYYQSQDITPDRVLAVRARQDDWFFDLNQRIHALQDFVCLPEAQSLAAACKRVNNILQQVQSLNQERGVNHELLKEPAEHALYERIASVEQFISPLYSEGNYKRILTALAQLRDPVDDFFDNVMVMTEDDQLKANRLNLLMSLQRVLQGVADISLLNIS